MHQVGKSDSVFLQLQTCDFIAQILKSLQEKRRGTFYSLPFLIQILNVIVALHKSGD